MGLRNGAQIVSLIFAATALSGCTLMDWRDGDDRNGVVFARARSTSMGRDQFMVSCVDSPSNCAEEANRLCAAYDVVSNVTNPTDFGRMTMIIKCHEKVP